MLDPTILQRAKEWLGEPFDPKTQQEVRRLIDTDPQALSDAFFKDLSFGTGGMRGLMGVGTNRMNIYTIRAVTQGLANYLNKQPAPKEGHSVFIGYDVRHHSKEFAEEIARVLAGHRIRVLLSEEICPTPLVSYGCRHYGCSGAIMITASHNPPTYNGYKIYWSDGGQVVPPHDEGIIEEVHNIAAHAKIPLAPLNSPLIRSIGLDLDAAYLKELKKLQLYPEVASSALHILYTPLHGTGMRIIPTALKSWGYSNVDIVSEQATPDGDFPKAPLPNPEEKKALELGVQALLKKRGDLLIATDPDADRMGIVARTNGDSMRFTGNQIACLGLFHICTALTARDKFPPNAAFIKTIVTTELFRKIAESFGGVCIDVLTGFKYIGEQITLWEKRLDAYQYIFGAEESYGYLFGTMVRDKDAISSACLIAEAAALAKKQGLTLEDRLYQIYQKFGIHREALATLSFDESESGLEKREELMQHLRKKPPSSIGGQAVVSVEDYQHGYHSLPPSDVLRFWLKDSSKLVIRPSGTEPKIKLYAEVVQQETKDIAGAVRVSDEKLQTLIRAFQREALA